VRPWEAEEAVLSPNRASRPARSGLRGIIGRTLDGRLLAVFYAQRGRNRIRLITARDADRKERRTYRRYSR